MIFLVPNLSRRILIYVRHYLECIFRGDAIPNFDDIAITVDLQTLEVGKRYQALIHFCLTQFHNFTRLT